MSDDWFNNDDPQQIKGIVDNLLQPNRTIVQRTLLSHGGQERPIDGKRDETSLNPDGSIQTDVINIQLVDDIGGKLTTANFAGISDIGELLSTNSLRRCAICHASVSVRRAVVVPPGDFENGMWFCRSCARRQRIKQLARMALLAVIHPFVSVNDKRKGSGYDSK